MTERAELMAQAQRAADEMVAAFKRLSELEPPKLIPVEPGKFGHYETLAEAVEHDFFDEPAHAEFARDLARAVLTAATACGLGPCKLCQA